jgi:long-chain acyl-CoA synthetase
MYVRQQGVTHCNRAKVSFGYTDRKVSWLEDRRRGAEDAQAFVWRERAVSYAELLAESTQAEHRLRDLGVGAGHVVALVGDHSPASCAMLLALAEREAIIVPLSARAPDHLAQLELAQVQFVLDLESDASSAVIRRDTIASHPLFATLRARSRPGLIVFSSGSTGTIKAALHDFSNLLERYVQPRQARRVLSFLLLDHLGGIHTLLHTLANGGTVVTVADRSPDVICAAIERHRVQLLPTSPTFLNMMLMSDAHRRFDLSSLELVTYGTEVMPGAVLARLASALPGVRLQQTYGLTELGVFPSRSRAPDSLWMSFGGEGYESRVDDGELWIRSKLAMLGYLNAPSPFDDDGWFNTHDRVLVDGDYIQILGRDSELINVGGQKVDPIEVERVLTELANVVDVTVYAHHSPITGNIVAARMVLARPEPLAELRVRVREHCASRLERHKAPMRLEIVPAIETTDRGKKRRSR